MLIQNPSRIFKSDLSVWKKERSCIVKEIVPEDMSGLRKSAEIVLDEDGTFDTYYPENTTVLMVVLYGEVLINDFEKPVSSEQVFILQSEKSSVLKISNHLPDEKADVLLFELKCKTDKSFFSVEDLNISERNRLIRISENTGYPNFIGWYEGRKEESYTLCNKERAIFGMVINGAFEFHNRLLENRDALMISGIDTLEFEALSENALILFLEV
ncbi:hypothetical protein [uncultured Chryseobacterium sp.]|uniref:pirin family protein n=1 Tax=uncultured Chryseobacterium sp. TaxID=259322 RepID=UPI0025D9CBAD|nr:hypothetical protein [uncultured Chryseobacterium sp.]